MCSNNKKTYLKSPALLNKNHNTNSFDCGEKALNEYLIKFAYINNQHSYSRTYVTCRNNQVMGYYTLTIGSVTHEKAPSRIRKGLSINRPIPIIILARLAVDKNKQGLGIGKSLLKDALIKSVKGAEHIGGRAVLVHAKNKKAKSFYQKYGFEQSPIDEYHLYLLLKDIKKTLGG